LSFFDDLNAHNDTVIDGLYEYGNELESEDEEKEETEVESFFLLVFSKVMQFRSRFGETIQGRCTVDGTWKSLPI
jgi:hypothetical protein